MLSDNAPAVVIVGVALRRPAGHSRGDYPRGGLYERERRSEPGQALILYRPPRHSVSASTSGRCRD